MKKVYVLSFGQEKDLMFVYKNRNSAIQKFKKYMRDILMCGLRVFDDNLIELFAKELDKRGEIHHKYIWVELVEKAVED